MTRLDVKNLDSNNQTTEARGYCNASICFKIKENPLDKDFKDFLKLIPVDKLKPILEKYSDDDKTLESFAWTLGMEYFNRARALQNLPEYKAFEKYLQESGYNGMVKFRILHNAYGPEEYVPPSIVRLNSEEYAPPSPVGLYSEEFVPPSLVRLNSENISETGINGFLKDYLHILPFEEIKRLHDKKMVESPSFIKFSTCINSDKYYGIVESLESRQEYKDFVQKSKEAGIDFVAIQNLKLYILGFGP